MSLMRLAFPTFPHAKSLHELAIQRCQGFFEGLKGGGFLMTDSSDVRLARVAGLHGPYYPIQNPMSILKMALLSLIILFWMKAILSYIAPYVHP